MNVSLPPSMQRWVRRHVGKKGYDSTDAFLLDILQREQALEARERIDRALVEAMDEGEATPITRKDWDRIRAKVIQASRGRPK